MATMMDFSSTNWLSELLEIDEDSIIDQHNMSSFAGTNSSQDLIEEKPFKLLKTHHICPKPMPSSISPRPPKINLPSSRILSFENFGSNANNFANHLMNSIDSPREEAASPNSSDGVVGDPTVTRKKQNGIKRAHPKTPSKTHAENHVIAERNRRQKLTQRFVALSAMLPGLKKMNKASVLGDAIKHIKHLQERVKEFDDQRKESTVESVVLVKKSQMFLDDNSNESNSASGSGLLEIQVRVSDKDVLIKIVCEKRKGHLSKILVEIEKLHLFIVNSSALPFGATLDITVIAQKENEFKLTLVEIAKNLRAALSKFM